LDKLGLIILFSLLGTGLLAQDPDIFTLDSIPKQADSIQPTDPRLDQIQLSEDSFEDEVKYFAQDSQWLDNKNRMVYLYGNATVDYQTLSLKADFIKIDLEKSIAFASGYPDSSGTIAGKPIFKDGSEEFNSDSIRYNFESKKGMVYQVRTVYEDIFIHGSKTKFFGDTAQYVVDSLKEDIVYNFDGLFTTCDLDHPHFGIRSKKQKIIPNKLVVVGPSYLEIAGVKTPLWLPFGFFPISKSRRAGLIIPRDYEFSPQWGYGIRNVGYYTPLGEKMDLRLTGDIYTRGSWGLNVASSYINRYRFQGNFSIGYANRISEVRGVDIPSKSFSIRWSHSQDSRAHPYRRLSGSVNIQTNGFQRTNFNDANSVFQRSLSSNVSYSRTFPGKPFSLSANFGHSQNIATQQITIQFPTLNFQMRRIYPFKNKKKANQDKLWDRISFKYDMNLQNQIRTTDSTLFDRSTFENALYGVRHKMSSDVNFKLDELISFGKKTNFGKNLKFINITPSVNYTEVWNFKTISKTLDPVYDIQQDTFLNADGTIGSIIPDTLSYGNLLTDTVNGFKAARLYNFNVSMQTALFGTINFKNSRWIKGIRHVFKPSMTFNYTPDYTREALGYYRRVDTDLREFYNNPELYNIFANSLYDRPSSSGLRAGMGLSATNIFEAKYFSKKDSTDKIFKLFDNVSMSTFHNFAADTLRWDPLNVRGTMRLFDNITTVTTSARFSPYVKQNGREINEYLWNRSRKIARLDDFMVGVSSSFQLSKLQQIFSKKKKKKSEEEEEEDEQDDFFGDQNTVIPNDPLNPNANLDQRNQQRDQRRNQEPVESESLFDVFKNFRVYHNFVFRLQADSSGVARPKIGANSINVQGNLQLTPKWSIRVGNIGYDFLSKSLSYPDIGFQRDLHCWEMSFNWQPVRGTYSFMIRVKGNSLNFIKIPYNKNNQDSFTQF